MQTQGTDEMTKRNWDNHFRRVIEKTTAMIHLHSRKNGEQNDVSNKTLASSNAMKRNPPKERDKGEENGSCGCSPVRRALFSRVHRGPDLLSSAPEEPCT